MSIRSSCYVFCWARKYGIASQGITGNADWLLHFVGRRQAAKSWSGGRHRVQRGGAALQKVKHLLLFCCHHCIRWSLVALDLKVLGLFWQRKHGHVLLGGAKLESRGVEGVTGCSGEGLHSRIWSTWHHYAAAVISDGCLLDVSHHFAAGRDSTLVTESFFDGIVLQKHP